MDSSRFRSLSTITHCSPARLTIKTGNRFARARAREKVFRFRVTRLLRRPLAGEVSAVAAQACADRRFVSADQLCDWMFLTHDGAAAEPGIDTGKRRAWVRVADWLLPSSP
jgi:hypothetical protein